MGFRFQKRIGLFPGVTLNLGKKGVSVSVGPRGAKTTIGARGIKHSFGIPGTGARWETPYKRWGNETPTDSAAPRASLWTRLRKYLGL